MSDDTIDKLYEAYHTQVSEEYGISGPWPTLAEAAIKNATRAAVAEKLGPNCRTSRRGRSTTSRPPGSRRRRWRRNGARSNAGGGPSAS